MVVKVFFMSPASWRNAIFNGPCNCPLIVVRNPTRKYMNVRKTKGPRPYNFVCCIILSNWKLKKLKEVMSALPTGVKGRMLGMLDVSSFISFYLHISSFIFFIAVANFSLFTFHFSLIVTKTLKTLLGIFSTLCFRSAFAVNMVVSKLPPSSCR